MDKRKRLFENTVFLYLMQFATYVFPFITTPYLTRVLLDNNYGLYSWANAVMNYARLVVDFGFVIYGVEAIARCKNDKKKIGSIIKQILLVKIVLSGLVIVLLLFLSLFVGKFQKNALLLCVSFLPILISVFNIDYVFQGMEQMRYMTIRVVLTKFIFTIFVFTFIKTPNQYILVPVFIAVGDLFATLMMWHTLIHRCEIRIEKGKMFENFDLLNKSTWYFASRIGGAVYTSGNLVLLGFFCGDSKVAQFSIAYMLISVAENMITPIATSAYPYMVKNKEFGIVKKIILIFEPIIIIGSIIVYFIAPFAITFVFGETYLEAVEIFRWLIPIVIISLPGCMIGFPVLSALGLYKETNIAIVVAALFHIVVSFILIALDGYNVISVAKLTCMTNFLAVLLRGIFVFKVWMKNKYKHV